MGDRSYRADDADAVRPSTTADSATALDLTNVDLSDLDASIRTRVDGGVGEVDVILPRRPTSG